MLQYWMFSFKPHMPFLISSTLLCSFDFTSKFRNVALTYTDYVQVANSLEVSVNWIVGICGTGTGQVKATWKFKCAP